MSRRHSSALSSSLLAIALSAAASVGAQKNAPVPDLVDLPAVLRLTREVSPRLALERQNIRGAEANREPLGSGGSRPAAVAHHGASVLRRFLVAALDGPGDLGLFRARR